MKLTIKELKENVKMLQGYAYLVDTNKAGLSKENQEKMLIALRSVIGTCLSLSMQRSMEWNTKRGLNKFGLSSFR